MCNLCKTFNFQRVKITPHFKNEAPAISLVYGKVSALPKNERFQFCPRCGQRLTEDNFKIREG